ncbi:hypothetical protein SSS_09918 [Sarcoptes scabiei]|nr:hypothetical protein SSS_09918 [Sarcoptes scabiei]
MSSNSGSYLPETTETTSLTGTMLQSSPNPSIGADQQSSSTLSNYNYNYYNLAGNTNSTDYQNQYYHQLYQLQGNYSYPQTYDIQQYHQYYQTNHLGTTIASANSYNYSLSSQQASYLPAVLAAAKALGSKGVQKNESSESIHQDDDDDDDDPTIAKPNKPKLSNVLNLQCDDKMGLNSLIYTNIHQSPYFKNDLFQLKTFQEVINEIYYNVKHLEPWEKGSRKVSGQTGMCGSVRGVGAGGLLESR